MNCAEIFQKEITEKKRKIIFSPIYEIVRVKQYVRLKILRTKLNTAEAIFIILFHRVQLSK